MVCARVDAAAVSWLPLAAVLLALAGALVWIGVLHARIGSLRRALRGQASARGAAEFDRVIAQERARIARDMHDDLGAGLTEIALISDAAAKCGTDRDGLRIIGTRAREALLALDEIVWAVDPGCDSLPRLADYLSCLADGCFEAAAVRCVRQVPIDLPEWPIRADVRHNIALAAKEALVNALRHARASEVRLRLEWDAPTLRLVVEDDGTGFDTGQPTGAGRGLANQRERMAQVGGWARVERMPAGGTRVTLEATMDAPVATATVSGGRIP